ncbi:PAS domain S-box protein [Mongoliitalea daihaiensis]|uniref:PAS domain S-box protein n=1 Tax=Mongoliitalea daihaiensis TaxID=2782006 RepID=UPI001F44BD9E|nr:PAS domain S-box protein [Mongoliitalea daihaiensis]UJP63741.1 PAS domain S-box protein [Mongoliitalea daihaiensis]
MSFFISKETELSFLRGIMRRSLDMVAILDKNGYYKYISPAVIDILGYEPSQIIGKSFREFVAKGAIEIDLLIFDQLLQSKEQMKVNFWMRKANGSRMLIENLAINLFDDPNIQGVLFNGRDITDLFYTKSALDKKYKLESLLASLSTKFLNSVYSNLDEAFNDSLEQMTAFFKAEKGFIYQVKSEKSKFELAFQWEEKLGYLPKNIDRESFVNFLTAYDSEGIVLLHENEEVSEVYTVFPRIFCESKSCNILLIPFYAANVLSGFFGISGFENKDFWSVKDLLVIKQLGDIFSGAFVNRSIKKQLDRNENLLINTEILAKSGSWRYSSNQKRVVITPGFRDLFELQSPNLNIPIREALKLISPKDLPVFIQKVRNTIRNGASETGELMIHSAKGVQKFVYFSIQSKPDFELKKPELYGYLTDITAIKKSREEIVKSEEKFRTLVEDSTEIIFSLQRDLTITYLSPNIEQYLGFESSKVIGSKLTQFMHPTDLEAFERFLREDEGFLSKTQFLEFRLRTKDETYKTFASNAKLVYTSDGEFLYNGIARDVTKLREAQKELILAKERAEMAANAKTQFLSIMSHEIRTPMNAVIGLTHLLIEDNPRPDQIENLKTLQFSAENLLGLINDILDFNKMESGKLQIEYISIDLKNLIGRMLASYKFQAREKELQIIFEYDDQIPSTLLGDPVRIGQIINNLVSNAIKFTEKGFVRVAVIPKKSNAESIELEFIIQDSGIGIPPDKLMHIFDAFTQASTETTRKFGGTGLGLAIVKKLIQLFGSEIMVKSELNKGTSVSFVLTLPKAKIAIDSSVPKIVQVKESLLNAHILIAEDNIVNQLMIKKFMKKWGVGDFTIVNDGEEAIEILQKESFDLIVLDLQMPKKDGIEVAKFVRTHSDKILRTLPIIAMTASPWEEIQEQFEALKMNDYVPKPFNPDSMYAKLVKHLQHNLSNS